MGLLLADTVKSCYNICAAPPNLATERGCKAMELLINFFVSVAAGILCYYICKWLDRHNRGQ